MRNSSALEVAIKLIDGVYADLIFRGRELKLASAQKKRIRSRINKLLRIRYRLLDFYAKMHEDEGRY